MSNEESDLLFDRENIRGKQIQYISSTAIRVVNPYVPGSLNAPSGYFSKSTKVMGK